MARLGFRMPSIQSAAGALALTLVATSIVAALVAPLFGVLALLPSAVLHGFVWQLLSYAFLERSPMGVIFGAIILWSIGGMLEYTWGRRRFLRFSLTITVLSGVATVLLWLLLPNWVQSAYAGSVLTGSLWVAYGLQIGRGQTNFWGLAVTGNVLALIGAGFVLLNVIFAGSVSAFVPELFGLLFTFLYMRGVQPELLWLRFRTALLNRQLAKRAAHLKSVDGGRRSGGSGSDKFLH